MIYIVYFFFLWNKPTSAQFVLESVTVPESRRSWAEALVEHRLPTPRFHQPHDQPEFKDQLQLPVSARRSVSTVCVNSCDRGVEYPLKSLSCLCQAGPPCLEALPGTLTSLTHQPARPPISSPVEKQTSHSESNSLRSKWATIFTFTLTSWTFLFGIKLTALQKTKQVSLQPLSLLSCCILFNRFPLVNQSPFRILGDCTGAYVMWVKIPLQQSCMVVVV